MQFLKVLWPSVLDTLAIFKDALRGRPTQVHPLDRTFGIETSRRVPRAALATGSDKDALSIGYAAGAAPSVIRKSLSLVNIEGNAEFIDLGCGKGRPLIVAAEFPFRALTGIELSPYLCGIARRNVK
jgi:SAM-dependent methyltransferase